MIHQSNTKRRYSMKKVLIAVDETRGSKSVLSVFQNSVRPPEEVILLHVQQLEGKSLMIDMLGEAELSTLKESLKGTEHQARLDAKAEKILSFYQKAFANGGLVNVRTVVRAGNPTDEILRVAEEENVELVIVGCNGKSGLDRLVTGCVSKGVERNAKVPVLIARETGEEKAPSWREAYAK